jgi:hypothetical protein
MGGETLFLVIKLKYNDFVAEIIHRMSIIPPPAYSEAPVDDLAAELAKMKAMMEQMGVEKERMETEAKHKAEEETVAAQLRAEQEEERELAVIHKKLNEDMMTQYHIPHGIAKSAAGAADQKFLEQLKVSGEIILYIIAGTKHHVGVYRNTIDIIITNHNIYSIRFHRGSASVEAGCGSCVCSSLYTFDKSLNSKQTKMLSILNAYGKYHGSLMSLGDAQPIITTMYSIMNDHTTKNSLSNIMYLDARKKFESVIRLIPGGYKNGDWRQLDGFFGMYYNESTMEVSEVPPPSI